MLDLRDQQLHGAFIVLELQADAAFELGMRREQRHRGDGLREQLAHVGRIRPRAEHGLDAGFVLDEGATYAEVRHQEFGQSVRSEEHTSELQSLMRTSYAVLCL